MLGFIKSQLNNDALFNSEPIIRRILDHPEGKKNRDNSARLNNNISMKDYNKLFKVGRFRPILEEYFASRRHYRDLINSGISKENRKKYIRKIFVFEKAFREGVFKRISGTD